MNELELKQQKDTREKEDKTKLSELSNPPAELKESQDDISEISARLKRQEIKLTDDERDSLKQRLNLMVDNWKVSRSGLADKLRLWNDKFEGVVVKSDFPWVGASFLSPPMAKIKARELKSVINRSVLRPEPFLMVKTTGPDVIQSTYRDTSRQIENFVEDVVKRKTNVHRTIKDAVNVITRDGTCPIQIIWETDWERVYDYKIYSKAEDFIRDYPTVEDAGVSDKEYGAILGKLAEGKTHEVLYEYDIANYDGPKAYIVPLIDFFHFPVYVNTLEDTLCHGKRIWFTDYQVQNMYVKRKFNDKEQVENLIASGGDVHDNDYTAARDSIEGISRDSNQDGDKEYEFFELVFKGAIKEADKAEGIQRKYLITYHHKSNEIFRVEPYPIRKGRLSYFLLRYIIRDNRLLGQSLIDDAYDIFDEIDILHRQRINSRTITHVPTFKAKEAAKDRFDPSRPNMRFQPGRVFWLKDMDDVQQFDIRPVDLSGSVDEEMLLFQLVDMVFGSTSGFSGQSNPIDPRAPARKEAQLMRMSANRIEDLTEPLIDEFPKIGQHIIDLYYQYGKDRIKYYVKTEDGELIENEIQREKLFNPNITFAVKGTSIFDNPEQEYQRNMEIHQLIGSEPITAQIPRIRKESLTRVLSSSRTPDPQKLIPNDQEIPPDLPTEMEKEAELKSALAAQKAADRLKEQTERNRTQTETELIRQVGQIQSKMIAQPPEAMGGVPGEQGMMAPTPQLPTAEATGIPPLIEGGEIAAP
jgi:hypothetical protein